MYFTYTVNSTTFGSIHKLNDDAGLDHAGEFARIPVGQTHTAVALGLANLRRFWRAVDAISWLV